MIGIHHRVGSFSDKWIEFFEAEKIPYKLVCCYDNDIVSQLSECKGLLWHWHHNNYRDQLFAKQLVFALERMGKKVFPDSQSSWHFDDKVGQKYLLEAIDAPLVPSYVFYDKTEALNWAERTSFPKIFKLRGGAGALNVKIVEDVRAARKLIGKAFSLGFGGRWNANHIFEKIWAFKRDKTIGAFFNILKGITRYFIPHSSLSLLATEKGYVYFQEFIPQNDCDYRVVVIGRRAFAIKRMVREDDFRASGSGRIIYDPNAMPIECIELAFKYTHALDAQCLAYDFIYADGTPLLVEISFGFTSKGYLDCPGYWTEELEWKEGAFTPAFFIIEDFLKSCYIKD